MGSDTHGEEDDKLSDHPSHNANKEKMQEDTGKENEDKDLVSKDSSQSKGVNEERMENMDINTNTQINTITSSQPRNVDDRRDDAKLSFLHTIKLKAETSLQDDSWMFNELMALKKK